MYCLCFTSVFFLNQTTSYFSMCVTNLIIHKNKVFCCCSFLFLSCVLFSWVKFYSISSMSCSVCPVLSINPQLYDVLICPISFHFISSHSIVFLSISVFLPDIFCFNFFYFIASCSVLLWSTLFCSIAESLSPFSYSIFPFHTGSVQLGSRLSCAFCFYTRLFCSIPLIILDTLNPFCLAVHPSAADRPECHHSLACVI